MHKTLALNVTITSSPHHRGSAPFGIVRAAIACAGFVFMTSVSLRAAQTILPGHVPPVVQGLQATGPVPANQQIRLALELGMRNKDDLAALLEQLDDPTSPTYHRYLTTEQFADMFGPTAQDHQAVIDFAQTNGFEVVGTFPNRLIVDVTASAANVESAFSLKLFLYQDPTSSRVFRAPNVDPSVPSTLPIVDIGGLDDYGLPQVNHVTEAIEPAAGVVPNGGSGSGGRWWGGDYRAIYVPGTALTGAGQRVGIFGVDLLDLSDITTYEDSIGYQHVPVTSVFLDGWQENWAHYSAYRQEVTADTELAISMAPGLAEVVVFRGNPTNFIANDILNAMATHSPTINQLSSSFSWPGGPTNTTDSIFQEMAAQGQTFFQASGDWYANWYYSCNIFMPPCAPCCPGTHLSVDDPSSPTTPQDNPYITLVGGTVVTTTGSPPPGSWATEVVWAGQDGFGYGTSGGPSQHYLIPAWQQGISMAANYGSTTFRNVPDVALVADNINIYCFGYAQYFAGTSAAAPLWAGLAALANQQAAQNGNPPIGFINPAIYQAAKGYSYTQFFHDIQSGGNNISGSTLFPAVAGYDLCAGWGSPAGANIINLLAPLPASPPSGLIGWWKGDGNALNSAAPDNATAEGSVTYAQGEVGFAFSLPGTGYSADIHIPNVAGQFDVGTLGSGLTLEGWIQPPIALAGR